MEKIIEKVFILTLIVSILGLAMPHISLAHTLANIETFAYRLPENNELRQTEQTRKIWISAYNSFPGQTDDTPCITASGLDVCERNSEDVIATNFLNLPFGTKVKFPELFGDKVFTVEDRMNKRYWNTADIWMKNYEDAVQFGRKWTTIEIY